MHDFQTQRDGPHIRVIIADRHLFAEFRCFHARKSFACRTCYLAAATGNIRCSYFVPGNMA
jgi:hypothetical protein